MEEQPRTRYVRVDELSIAYQVFGEGPLDLVVVPGGIWHIDLLWADPSYARFMQRLASFARVIIHDRPGMGASDPCMTVPTIEDRIRDLRAVMGATACNRVAMFGISEGGPTAAMFAAIHPDRVQSLIMYGTYAAGDRAERNDDYPWDRTEAFWSYAEDRVDHFGEGWTLEIFARHRATTARQRALWGTFERTATSPAMVRQTISHARSFDIRELLPTIRVPTLLLHRTNDPLPVEGARYIAARIPGATLIEMPGDDHIPWLGDGDDVADRVEEFVTGVRAPQRADRVLATILFTDIVDSTRRAAELGDAQWRRLIRAHDELARAAFAQYEGREIKHTGDGFLASFDGPARAIRCAQEIIDGVRALDLEVRAGVHTGECERTGEDLRGIAVHVGARVGALAEPDEVLVSSTVKELVLGSQIAFDDRGEHELKGLPGQWRLFAARGDRQPVL